MLKSVPLFKRRSFVFILAVLFWNDLRRKPSKQDINVRMLHATVTCRVYLFMHACAGHARKGNGCGCCHPAKAPESFDVL